LSCLVGLTARPFSLELNPDVHGCGHEDRNFLAKGVKMAKMAAVEKRVKMGMALADSYRGAARVNASLRKEWLAAERVRPVVPPPVLWSVGKG